MTDLPKLRFFFKGFPEDVRFRAHTVPQSLEIAKGTLYQAWFDALVLSPYYANAIDTNLWPSQEARDTFAIFGDLRRIDFDQWWVERGYELFAEKQAFRKIAVNAAQDASKDALPTLSLEVPLNVSPATLKRQFDQLLRVHHPHYKNFDRWQASSAPVRFENRKLTSVSINLYLQVYRSWRAKIVEEREIHLFEIGEELNLDPKLKVSRTDYPREASAKHLKMSLIVTEYLEKAKNLVAHATEGRFPCVDDHPWIERKTRSPRKSKDED
jgi:hypothetical protein